MSIVFIVPFQNCSPGFEINEAFSSLSLSSTAAIRLNAKAVLQKNCFSCHNGATAANFNLLTDKEFIDAGLITPGSPSKSKLMYRLKNYPTDMGAPRDMPKGGTLSTDDYSVLKTWVENMANPNSTNPFACNENEAPDTLNAKRLTRRELANLYNSVVARGVDYNWSTGQLAPTDSGTVSNWMINNYLNAYDNLPPDSSSTYSTADSNFSALHAQAYFNVADQLIQFIIQNNNATNFVGNYIKFKPGTCSFSGDPANLSPACQTAFVKNLVLRAWGREVESDDLNANNELASLMQEFSLNSGLTAVNNLIFRVFMAPEFYFHLNSSVNASGSYYRLSSYAIARRLSYIFTQGPPDENLLAIASSQDLLTDAGFNAALDYLSANMNGGVNQFSYEWLNLDLLPQFKESSLPKFQYVAKLYSPDLGANSENFRKAMKDDVVELVNYITNSNQGLKDLFNTNVSFARDPTLMSVYGVSTAAPPKGSITESNAVRFPAGERSGLLTRAAVLFAGGQTENPMHRGVSIRKNLFCKSISLPPPTLSGALIPPPPDATMTTRERYTHATSASSCMGCHSLINPVGFAFSKYNAFGGYQPLEPVVDWGPGNVPTLTNSLPTDATTYLGVSLNIDRDIDGGVQFSDVISNATDVKSCLAQNFYTYENGLNSLPGAQSSCSMNRMYQSLDSQSSLKDVFRASVLNQNFRYRNIQK